MKNKVRAAALSALMSIPALANAGECEQVIALSKEVRDTVKTQSDFDENAEAFCNEYFRSESSRNSRSYGASYKFLSASIGKENASESEIASKFCSAKSGSSKKDSAYKEYVGTIAKEAYGAYQKCKELEGAGLTFDIDTAGIRKTDLSISVAYNPGKYAVANSEAKVSVTASPGFYCRWDGVEGALATVSANSALALQCTRNSPKAEGYIKILAKNIGSANPLTLNWQTYADDGTPIDLAKALTQKLEEATERLDSVVKSLAGAVVPFNSDQCPSGWTEYAPAYGRFIRGIDNSGSNIDPDGKRQPGSFQSDDIKAHAHPYNDIYWSEAWGSVGKNLVGNKGDQDGDNKGYEMSRVTGETGGKETRPKNIAMLFCIRK